MSRGPKVAPRPKNDISAELLNSILMGIGDLFYPGRRDTPEARKTWAIDQNFYRKYVVTWAAKWLDDRGVTLSPDKFKLLLLDKLTDIKRNTATEVKYLPKYLAHCIQDHFKHNEQAIYDEAKSLSTALDQALHHAKIAQGGIDPIRVLALAHQVAKQPKRPKREEGTQLPLF